MNDDSYYEQEPEAPQKSKLARLIAKMGLGAFTISLLVHAVFIILAIFFFIRWVEPPQPKIDFLPGGGGGGGNDGNVAHKVQKQMRQKMMTSTAVSKRIATSGAATFTLPDSSNELMDPGLPMDIGEAQMGSGGGDGGGRGTGSGKGTGSGTGPGRGVGAGQLGIGALIPTIMKGRCTDNERLQMIKDAGGTPQVEDAVKKSLKWLQGKQNSEGSWGNAHQVAMTGLSLLCYLGHCEGTQSPEYGENVARGITYLINVALKNEGRMASQFTGNSWVYEHAIATYALSEALTFSRNLQFPIPELESTVEKAANAIIKGQNEGGSWDYGYKDSERNDLSVAGWQMQALKAAKASGVKLEDLDKTIRDAVKCLEDTSHVGEGRFAYTGNTAHPGMTAVGALCLQQWDKSNSKPVREAVKIIMTGLELRDRPNPRLEEGDFARLYTFDYDGPNNDLYAWYYAVQVMRNAEGREWDAMNKAILADIVSAQTEDGSFRPEMGGGELVHVQGTKAAGTSRDIYLQTLNTLILEVYYRFLPATSAGKAKRMGGLQGLDDLR